MPRSGRPGLFTPAPALRARGSHPRWGAPVAPRPRPRPAPPAPTPHPGLAGRESDGSVSCRVPLVEPGCGSRGGGVDTAQDVGDRTELPGRHSLCRGAARRGGPGEEDIPRALPPLSASPKPRCPLRNAEGRTCAVPRHRQLRPRICLPLIQPTPTLGTPVFPSNHSGRRRRQQGPPGPRAGPRQGPHPHTALQVPGSRQSHPRAPARAPLQSEQPGKHCGPSGAERREADGAQARALCRAGPRGQPGPACGRLSELKWPLTELIRLRQRQLSTEPENLPESAA